MARQTEDRGEDPRASELIMALGGCWVLLGTVIYYMIAAG